jgi:hypothetical protein
MPEDGENNNDKWIMVTGKDKTKKITQPQTQTQTA